jgi:alpha-glucosidase (family GH31 glycosyl hydrolase)
VLDWQDDPTTLTLDDQYLFGRSLLVAPILDERNRRRVYLPAGRWVAYWTKEVLAGGRWIEVDAPLDVLPIYVKAGALLPYGPLMQHTDEHPLDPLTLELYLPDSAGEYTIYEETHAPLTVRYRRHANRLTLEVGAARGAVEVVIWGVHVQLARCAGKRLPVTQDEQGGSHVRFEGRSAQSIEFFVEESL